MYIPVNSTNISQFGFSVTFDIYNRTILFDTTQLTIYNGSGASNVLGISFGLQDEQGIDLAIIDFNNPQIPNPSVTTVWELDLSSSVSYNFLFERYAITGAIKDSDGKVYTLTFPIKSVCQPDRFTELGYVSGIFQVIPDCSNNVLTVKELTPLVYANKKPISENKSGQLFYPTGTISPVSFSNTPFQNNVIYTGENRIKCTTAATYDFNDDVYVSVTYITDEPFPVTCTRRMADITCCISKLEKTKKENCGNALGERAAQQLSDVTMLYLNGLTKEISGQDTSFEVNAIKKQLDCDCGVTSIIQNEPNPTNPSIYSIVLNGAYGTSVPSPTISGNTKTYTISSNVYQVVKNDNSDLGFSILSDTSTAGTVRYKIGLNYIPLSTNILNSIKSNPQNLALLNSLISNVGGGNTDLTGLDGKCIIDLETVDYLLQQAITINTKVVNIVVNGVVYNAPLNLYATNTTGVQSWLNSLTVGSFQVSTSTASSVTYLNILSAQNTNSVATLTLNDTSDVTYAFGSTSVTLIQFLQALIDYLCNLTLAQIKLANILTLNIVDAQGGVTPVQYPTTTSGQVYLNDFTSSFNNLVNKVNAITSITCEKVKALFTSYPNAVFASSDYIMGTKAGFCAQLSAKDIALIAISGINANIDVKQAFCAIQCSAPAPCPDIAAISLAYNPNTNVVGLYGVTFTTTPTLNQQTTLRYRLCGTTQWTVVTVSLVILPSGTVSGASPFTAINNPAQGACYEVYVQNNCGGNGFIGQISVPAQVSAITFVNNINTNAPENCCPAGYTITDDQSSCFQVDQQTATYVGSSNPIAAQHYSLGVYGTFGTAVYKLGGFNVDGTWPLGNPMLYPNIYTTRVQADFPNATAISYASGVFINNTSCSLTNGTCGRLNQCGIWNSVSQTYSGSLGFSRQIDIPTSKVYYIGVGGDDYNSIVINGTTILQQNVVAACGASYLNAPSNDGLFKFWNVYPVFLNAGPNLIQMTTTNVGSSGILGFEIYDADEATIIGVADAAALAALTIFSTKDIVNGDAFEVGNYSCSSYPGYQLVNDNGTYYCRKVLTTNVISCS